jgi:hypothetical protein
MFYQWRRIMGSGITRRSLVIAFMLTFFLAISGCKKDSPAAPVVGPTGADLTPSGEMYLIEALTELEAIADLEILPRTGAAAKISADTVLVYGMVSPEGTGMVVTERHTFQKGIPLITVRKSYGGLNGRVVTETWKYSSEADFQSNRPDQWSISEIYPGVVDTIVTRVTKNTGTEVFTFTLPIISRTTNTVTGAVQQTARFARLGAVVTEVTGGSGLLVRRTSTTGLATGAVQTTTEQADGSWRRVSTLGRADGTVLKTITTGQ